MISKKYKKVLLLTICSAFILPSASANGDAEFVGYYANSKPKPGGITPSTKSEYAMCWMAWSKFGEIIIAGGDEISRLHPDWNVQTADALFQHWWKKSEDAYGKDSEARMIKKAQEFNDYYNDNTKTKEILETAGLCFVPNANRVSFKKARGLKKYLAASKVPERGTTAQSQPQQPARPRGVQWVYGEAKGKTTNYTCKGYFGRTESTAKANAKQACRKAGGTPAQTAIITDTGYDVYNTTANQCYIARAKVECDFGQ